MRRPGTAGKVLAMVVAVAALALFLRGERPRVATTPVEPAAEYDQRAPNIVVVMTDDQALDTTRSTPSTPSPCGCRAPDTGPRSWASSLTVTARDTGIVRSRAGGATGTGCP